jgi:hypothetical protein
MIVIVIRTHIVLVVQENTKYLQGDVNSMFRRVGKDVIVHGFMG